MREIILALLASWIQVLGTSPFYTTAAGMVAGLGGLQALASMAAARIEARGHVAGRPLLILSAGMVMLLCLAWAAIDAVLAWQNAPLLGERLLLLLVPDRFAVDAPRVLRAVLGLTEDAPLRLPAAIALPVGLAAAGALYLAIASVLGSVLAELVSLQARPLDVILAEQARALEARKRRQKEAEARQTAAEQAAAQRAQQAQQATPGTDAAAQPAADRTAAEPTRAQPQPSTDEHGRVAAQAAQAPPAPDTAPEAAQGSDHASAPATADDPDPDAEAQQAAHGPPLAPPLANDGFGRLYKLLGHWNDYIHVERRFLRWYQPLARTVSTMVLAGVAPALLGHLPVAVWVGAAVLAGALRLQARPRPEDQKQPDEPAADQASRDRDDVAEHNQAPVLALQFLADPALASRLAPVPMPRPGRKPAVPASTQAGPHGAAGRPAQPLRAGRPGQLMGEVLAALGVSDLYEHQARAASAFAERRSVLLCTPPGSGRALVTDALVLQAVLADAERVLYLAPDAERAGKARERFEARAEATHWKWNIPAMDLTRPASSKDPGAVQPALVFAHPGAVHRELCRRQDRWHTFLAGLGVVVLVDVHAYGGAAAAHLAHLLNRLFRAMCTARAATPGRGLALADIATVRAATRVLATVEPGFADVLGFAQRIAGCQLERIGPEHDTAPRPAQSVHVVRPGHGNGSGAASALALRDAARAAGLRAELDGYGEVLSLAEQDPLGDGAHADVIVTRLSPARYAALPVLTSHLGAVGAHPAAVLWQPDPEPLAGQLARTLPGLATHAAPHWAMGDAGMLAPRLVAWPQAAAIERSQLLCTLAESEARVDELAQGFSSEVIGSELAALRARGRLIERTQRLLDARTSAIHTVTTVRLAAGDEVHERMDLAVCGEPWQLVERATGSIVASLAGSRALAAAYPRRVLIAGSRRLVVLDIEAQDQRSHRRILCEPTDEQVLTAPIRSFALDVIERRERREAGERRERREPGELQDAAERRKGGMRHLGGEPFSLQHRDASIDEAVLGVRRFDLGGRAVDVTAYDEPVHCRFVGRVAVIGFLSRAPSPEILHALVHGFRSCLPALLGHGEDDLEIAALPERSAIAFVDLHPGGAGFAEAITLDLVRHLVRAARSLLRGCPDQCTEGCPSCVLAWTCREPGEPRQAMDKAGAERVLAALLGSA